MIYAFSASLRMVMDFSSMLLLTQGLARGGAFFQSGDRGMIPESGFSVAPGIRGKNQ
jgi:hypothetical protein